MGSFTRALGVRCTFCHVGEESLPIEKYDFASDEKPTKRKAREMLRMVAAINEQHLAKLEKRLDPPVTVQCFTCHRGVREPRPLSEVLLTAYKAAGLDSAIRTYRSIRDRYYGRAAYDFAEVALADVANGVTRLGNIPDAVRLLELNVEMVPNSVFAQRQYVNKLLELTYDRQPADSGAVLYRQLKGKYPADAVNEETLNTVGYALLGRGRTAPAVAALKLNAELFPQSWNAFDSMGEALAAAGDIKGAISGYERSLALNPGNTAGRQKLEELRRRR
jgi:tetratricopeptide (TPR) repeat protein